MRSATLTTDPQGTKKPGRRISPPPRCWFLCLGCVRELLGPTTQRLPDQATEYLGEANSRLSPVAGFSSLFCDRGRHFGRRRQVVIEPRVVVELVSRENHAVGAEAAGLHHKHCLGLFIHDQMEDSGLTLNPPGRPQTAKERTGKRAAIVPAVKCLFPFFQTNP